MTPLWCFDFSEDSERQIESLGFPFDKDERVMFMNLLCIDEGILLIKNYNRYTNTEKYQRVIVSAFGQNPDLRISTKTKTDGKNKLFLG